MTRGIPIASPNDQPQTARLAAAAFLVLAAFMCYIPALRGDFVWDDDRHVSENRTLRSKRGLLHIWFKRGATVQYYPLTHTSFWIEYRLWGLNTTGYHVTNVLLHGINAILVWKLLRRLGVPGAYLAAAAFALHPVNVESVAWITERKNVLATFFMLLSLLVYLRLDVPGYLASFALFACALLSKTIACSMPAVLVLLLWWQHRLTWQRLAILLPFFALGLVLGMGTAWMERNYVGAFGPDWELSFLQRNLIASRAIWFYAGKLLWPANLIFSYPRWEIDVREPLQYLPLVSLIAVIVALGWSVRWLGRGPLVAALIYIGTLFPALGFINVYPMRYSFVADHFQYISSIALIALVVAGLARAWERWLIRPRLDAIRLRFALANSAVLLVVLGVLTWRQAGTYQNVETLWRDTIRKNPASWMAKNNLGAVLAAQAQGDLNAGRRFEAHQKLNEARLLLEEVERARPMHLRARLSRAKVLDMLERHDQALPVYDAIIRDMKQIVANSPQDAQTRTSLGYLLGELERVDEAQKYLEEALKIDPNSATARDGLKMLEQLRQRPATTPSS